jgi:hypothetical protein
MTPAELLQLPVSGEVTDHHRQQGGPGYISANKEPETADLADLLKIELLVIKFMMQVISAFHRPLSYRHFGWEL